MKIKLLFGIIILIIPELYSQVLQYPWNRTTVIMGYIGKSPYTGKDTIYYVDSARGHRIPVDAQVSVSATATLDSTSQSYTNKILESLLPQDTTITFSRDVTTSALALPSYPCRQIDLTVDYDYGGTIYVGSVGLTTTNGIPLKAGDAVTFYVSNSASIYYLGTEVGTASLRVKLSRKK